MYLSYLYWNPPREIFYIPILHFPILWYSLLFAFGFFVGYYIFYFFLKRYFLNFYYFHPSDIRDSNKLISSIKNPITPLQKDILKGNEDVNEQNLLSFINSFFKKDIPYKKIRGVLEPDKSSKRLSIERAFVNCFFTIKQKAFFVADKVTFYVVIATIIGARLGHLIFYEDFSYYITHPIEIIKFWDGGISGLASHGAAIGITIALFVLSIRLKVFPKLHFLTLLDLISVPTCFVGGCIRIGNFFNQEILGKVTNLWWGVQFGDPIDGKLGLIRHPVQIYEALFYFLLFGVFQFLSYKPKIYLNRGKLFSLFLISIFSFRFLIEFLKENQSIIDGSFLNMGQYLSIPFIILGIILFLSKKKDDFSLNY